MEREVDNKLAFLDILVNNNPLNLQTSVFHKKTFTGLLINYFSFTSFSYKMGLVRTLVDRLYKINNSWLGFHNDIKDFTLILGKNLFPVRMVEKVINRYVSRATILPSASSQVQQAVSTYYFQLPYVDFNVNYFNSSQSASLNNLFVRDNNYRQLVSSFTTDRNTCIDHIYTNLSESQIQFQILETYFSDHKTICALVNF